MTRQRTESKTSRVTFFQVTNDSMKRKWILQIAQEYFEKKELKHGTHILNKFVNVENAARRVLLENFGVARLSPTDLPKNNRCPWQASHYAQITMNYFSTINSLES